MSSTTGSADAHPHSMISLEIGPEGPTFPLDAIPKNWGAMMTVYAGNWDRPSAGPYDFDQVSLKAAIKLADEIVLIPTTKRDVGKVEPRVGIESAVMALAGAGWTALSKKKALSIDMPWPWLAPWLQFIQASRSAKSGVFVIDACSTYRVDAAEYPDRAKLQA